MVIPIAQLREKNEAGKHVIADAEKLVQWFDLLEEMMQRTGTKVQIRYGSPENYWETLWYNNPLLALDVVASGVSRMEDKR